MGLIRINRNPSRRELNVFGVIWLVVLSALGVVAAVKWNTPMTACVLWALAVVVPAVGLAAPSFMRVVYVGMCYAALPIGLVVSHVVLALVYFGVITPIGLLMRLFGYDPMCRRFDPSLPSYWSPREHDEDPKRYFHQS